MQASFLLLDAETLDGPWTLCFFPMENRLHFCTDSHRQVWLVRPRPHQYSRKQKEKEVYVKA